MGAFLCFEFFCKNSKQQPKKEKNAEAHKKYVDIHYIIKGEEIIGCGEEGPKNKPSDEYSADTDAATYTTLEDEDYIDMTQGMCAIFFPGDIHRPGCDYKEQSYVVKAVVKVSVELL